VGIQVFSPSSVSMVNTPLMSSQSREDGFCGSPPPPSRGERGFRGDCQNSGAFSRPVFQFFTAPTSVNREGKRKGIEIAPILLSFAWCGGRCWTASEPVKSH
jgi:hypothetical protein